MEEIPEKRLTEKILEPWSWSSYNGEIDKNEKGTVATSDNY